MTGRREVETARDQADSGFTPILRRLFDLDEAVLAVVFVDREGECVDYCTSIDAYEAKVVGAHFQVLVDGLRRPIDDLQGGDVVSLLVLGESREVFARRMGDDMLLVVVVQSGAMTDALFASVEEAAGALLSEGGIDVESWDPLAGPLEVRTRRARGWGYAPETVTQLGRQMRITDVLGRWVESGGAGGGSLNCFRVRTEDGDELTLAHDVRRRRWFRW